VEVLEVFHRRYKKIKYVIYQGIEKWLCLVVILKNTPRIVIKDWLIEADFYFS